ncbi:MAG: glycoside hydrolase family 3 N-terminal domain-containing protein [Candidatus Cyclobacteriaceae bacterium M3_2C_046]
MKLVKKFLKLLLYVVASILTFLLLTFVYVQVSFSIKNAKSKALLINKSILEANGYTFRDLNNNGQLDIYEDSRQPTEARIENLLEQMTIEEKVGLMWHPSIGIGSEGEILTKPAPKKFFLGSTYDYLVQKKLRTFNLFGVPATKHLAQWQNDLQKIAEQDRLGIPVTLSTDPRHGINNFVGNDMLGGDWSTWPEPIGLAATNDSALVVEFGRIAAKEYRAVGITTALHPMADLATEPRWSRINGTFGEDADLSAKMIAAYIYGFQGKQLGSESVATMTKHWPGGGPQKDGWDPHFSYGAEQIYPGYQFEYHLKPFKAAFEAGTAMIMPYYGIPVDQTSENVGMSFNKEIIQDLLRKKYQYDGLVCSDWSIIEGFSLLGYELFESTGWGVENLTPKQKIKRAIDAGVDQFGGNSNTAELLELVQEGSISEERINQSVRRILKTKFQLGLFEDPYVDLNKAVNIVGSATHQEKGDLAQRKSIVLLKNKMDTKGNCMLPLTEQVKIYVENIDQEIAGKYGQVIDSLKKADFAVLRLQAPFEPRTGSFMEAFLHQGYLDFPQAELNRILNICRQKPTIICIYLDRPAVIPEITDQAAGLMADFGAYDEALLDIVFGRFNPQAKLPFEMPSSMRAVENQYEDVPYDSENPLFPFGHGLTYESEPDSVSQSAEMITGI